MDPLLDQVPKPWSDRFRALGAIKHPDVKAVVLVGGSVRDLMLGRTPFDWDIMVEGDINPVLQAGEYLFKTVKTVRHPAFLTSTLHFSDGTFLDVVTARTETYEKPGALPKVKRAVLADDFQRRDFTVNAMALHLTPEKWGELVDPFDGRRDVADRLIRDLHDQSFIDDPTRIHRAARYAGRYGWRVENRTEKRILDAVKKGLIGVVSPARRRNELTKLLEEPNASAAMKYLHDWGAWPPWSAAWRWTDAVAATLSNPKTDLTARLSALHHSGDETTSLQDLKTLTYPGALLKTL